MNKKSHLSMLRVAMMVAGLASIGFMHIIPVQAAANVSGIIGTDTTWTAANSPYALTGNVLVNNGATLTIQAGTTVNLSSYYIMVNGTLQALGNSYNPITFNGGQITFTQHSTNWTESTGTGCIIHNAILNPIVDNALSSAILSINSSVKISNNTIQTSQPTQGSFYGSGIDVTGGSPIITENVFSNNYQALYVSAGSPIITGNIFSSNSYGVTISGYCPNAYSYVPLIFQISNNTFYNNNMGISLGYSIFASCYTNITGNLIIDNSGNSGAGIGISGMDNYPYDYPYNYTTNILNNTISSDNIIGIWISNCPPTSINFTGNNIFGNSLNLKYQSPDDFNADNNWWGTTDTQAINQTIWDFKNDFTSGTVDFVPFLALSNSNAPTYVNASAGDGGSIAPSGTIKVNYGDSRTFNITVDTSYHIFDVLVNGTSVGAVNSYTAQNIQGATTITATFAPDPTPSPAPVIPEFQSRTILPLLITIVISTGLLTYFKKRKH